MDSPSNDGSQCASSAKKSRPRRKNIKSVEPKLDKIPEMFEPPQKPLRKPSLNQGTQKCSQQAYYKLIKGLTRDQRAFIVAADLGHLLKIHPVNIRRHMCRWLAHTYDVKSKSFILKDGPVTITLQDVVNLMGLPSQGHDFHPILSQRTSALYAELKDKRELKDKKETGITYSSLLERMSNPKLPLEEFLQCFVLYTIGKILCPTTGLTVNSKYLTLVDSVQKVRSINWAKLTLDHLLESIEGFKLGKANLEGNLPLLQVWYWEKFRCDTIDETLDYSEREVPLMQYWTEQKARKVDKIDERYSFAAGTLVKDFMKPPAAKKKSFKSAVIPPQNMPVQDLQQLVERLEDISTSIMENRGLSKIEYDHLVSELTQTRNEVRRLGVNMGAVMLHLGIQDTGLHSQTNKDKFGDHLSMNLEPCFQADKSQYSLKRKRGPAAESLLADKSQQTMKKKKAPAAEFLQADKSQQTLKKKAPTESGTIGQRLRGPAGRIPTPSLKADFVYPGKESKGKAMSQSEAKVQSEPYESESNYYETMSERYHRLELEGRARVVPVRNAERDEMDKILDWVNTTPPNANIVQIDSLTISQRHLECLTNPYLDERDKYLGDEVIDAFIEHYKLTKPEDIREDGSVFIERVLNTFALENDGRKNSPVRLRMGGSQKGLDYLTHQLIFLPMHMKGREHWFLVSVNTRTQHIQILNSMIHESMEDQESRTYLRNTLRGLESQIQFALKQHGHDVCTWAPHPERNFNVASWPIEVIKSVPQQRDYNSCGLYLIKNILLWNGRWLIEQYDQACINQFRPMVAVTLIKSPHNKEKKGPMKDNNVSSEI